MSKNNSAEKITALQVYVDGLKSRLSSPIPEKHKAAPQPYIDWLNREIAQHTKKLEDLKMYLVK